MLKETLLTILGCVLEAPLCHFLLCGLHKSKVDYMTGILNIQVAVFKIDICTFCSNYCERFQFEKYMQIDDIRTMKMFDMFLLF